MCGICLGRGLSIRIERVIWVGEMDMDRWRKRDRYTVKEKDRRKG